MGLRLAVAPECFHFKWNAFKRAIDHSNLQFDMMRLTVASNYPHGTKLTGERGTLRKQMLQSFLAKQDEQYYEDISEEIALDRGITNDGVGQDACRLLLEDFLETPSIRKRGDYASQPSWYKIVCVGSFHIMGV